MLRGFFNAVTGMDAARFWIDVTSNNISNTNTVGYKAQRPLFQDVLSQVTIGLNVVTGTIKSTTYGAGVAVDSTQKIWAIGNFKQTGVNTDLAIQGRGLFILKDPVSNAQIYTRDGRFRLSRQGYMVTSGGFMLQGFKLNDAGEVVGTGLENIHVQQQIDPQFTNIIRFLQPSNLNASVSPPPVAFDPTNPVSYNYKYTITIYDSLGNPYQADVFFAKSGTNTWNVYLRSDLDPANAGYELSGDWTGIQFDGNGDLIYDGTNIVREISPDATKYYYYLDPANITINPPTTPSGGSFGNTADWRIYVGESLTSTTVNTGDPIPTGYINQYASDFIVTMEQNGYAKGDLIDVYVLSEDGSVVGVYSNGKSLPLYRVALAVFTDPEELTPKGANLYTSITTPTVLLAGGSEKVRSGMLEMSNADIAKEFINLITAQRTYQANARVITTSNTILDETVNLVR